MTSAADIEREEDRLRRIAASLPEDQRRVFQRRWVDEVRDPDTYAVLNYLFITGLHHFYLGNWLRGLLNIAGFIAGVALIFLGHWAVGLGLIGVITAAELWALFTAQRIVARHNNQRMRELLGEFCDTESG